MNAIVWVTTKVIHPFSLVPALKAILELMAHLSPYISAQILKQIVERMIMNDGQLNDKIVIEGQQVQLQSEIFPTDLSNIPIKYFR